MLEHIPHVYAFQQELQRVLKDEGITIHILPTGAWRVWSCITHYPAWITRIISGLRRSKSSPAFGPSNSAVDCNVHPQNRKKHDWMQLVRNSCFPPRHGEFGNCISEIYYFSKFRWSRLFRRAGWTVKAYRRNRLFYTGYTLFGSKLKLSIRHRLSYGLGSSCHIFVLEKCSARAQRLDDAYPRVR
jgi:hypothetical protein